MKSALDLNREKDEGEELWVAETEGKLILWTASPRKSAIGHYEKFGFRPVEERENTTWSLEGEKITEIKMVMSL